MTAGAYAVLGIVAIISLAGIVSIWCWARSAPFEKVFNCETEQSNEKTGD
jgi:hypothetical protein